MLPNCNLLTSVLSDPRSVLSLELKEWDLVIRQARRAGILSRLAVDLGEDVIEELPKGPACHLESSMLFYRAQTRGVSWEVRKVAEALNKINLPVILLKGAAYSIAGLPSSRGRLFNDFDILVPKSKLDSVEKILNFHGWFSTVEDEYDQRYYREWMHELPPLRHLTRRSVLDVHHTILPETSRLRPDPNKLIDSAQSVAGFENIFVLKDVDMVLHSAAHLFHDGELENGFRDLIDLDTLFRHFSTRQEFWGELVGRAVEMNLERPLYFALRYTQKVLNTPIPGKVIETSLNIGGTGKISSKLMDALFLRALLPDHSSCNDTFTPIARWLLYVRSHYLRMPPYLLIPHLIRKSLKKHNDAVTKDNVELENQ
ncbi:MAG: nucleotidyltransferase family protein [Sedimenticola sp.]